MTRLAALPPERADGSNPCPAHKRVACVVVAISNLAVACVVAGSARAEITASTRPDRTLRPVRGWTRTTRDDRPLAPAAPRPALRRGLPQAPPARAGGVLALGCYDDGRLCGVAILGRPVARLGHDGERLDVIRVATDGTRNAGSALYGRCRRLSQVLGLLPPQTHTLPDESGASLRGAGYVDEGVAGGGEWSREGRERAPAARVEPKRRWRA